MWNFNVQPVNILPFSIYHHKLGWTSSGPILHNIIHVITRRWIMVGWIKNNHLKTQTMHVYNTKIKHMGHHIFTLLLQYTAYIAAIFTSFITLFQLCSSNSQGLCYQTQICYFIWNLCVQTAIRLQQHNQRYSSCLTIRTDTVTRLKKNGW